MTNKKAPPGEMRLNYIYRLTMGCLCGKFVLSDTGSILSRIKYPVSSKQKECFEL
jgi:hypothetical protein